MTTSGFTRREFTLALAGSAALATDQPSAIGQEAADSKGKTQPPKSAEKPEPDKDAASEKELNEEPREPPPEAAYLLGLIMRRYPDERLDETAVAGIIRDIYGDLARSRALSSFPLDNSDEPGFTFNAWRAD
ncbi:MAG: hypothetical protein ACKVHE_08430 [Planctomycetales bacterium]|jgi:hypothetical protein